MRCDEMATSRMQNAVIKPNASSHHNIADIVREVGEEREFVLDSFVTQMPHRHPRSPCPGLSSDARLSNRGLRLID